MLCSFKAASQEADQHPMTNPSGASRFRTGRVIKPATPADRIRRVLDDRRALQETFEQQLELLAAAHDWSGIVDLCAAVDESVSNRHMAYALHRIATSMLATMSSNTEHDDSWLWAEFLDASIAVAMRWLAHDPHEPELVNLLGVACFELGHTAHARRLFEALREIAPEQRQLRQNLRACKVRMQRGVQVPVVPEAHTPAFLRHRSDIKRLAERVRRLEDRTISLCMIVKNEAEMLPECLARVADHVDQIVVVDTGSTDDTREIAHSFGAQVVEFPWNGSFSDARNAALDHATGDWILYLDADEHMVDGDGAQLRELARKTWYEGLYLIETHFTGEDDIGVQSTHTPMRMFQRREQYRWEGIVHEQVMNQMPTWLSERFAHTTVRIDHYGYLKSIIDDRDKRQRNLTLLMQQAEERRDTFVCFNIGSEYGAIHDWTSARPWFEEALQRAREHDGEGWQQQQFAPMLVMRTVTSRRGTGDLDAAIALIDEALGWWPEFTDLEFERALILRSLERDADAERAVERCLSMGDAPARFVAVQGRGSHQARALLAALKVDRGDVEGARGELERAIIDAPHYLPTILELAAIKLRDEPADAVQAWFAAHLGERMNGTSATLLLATAFHEAGCLDHADACYDRVLASTPDHSLALVAQAELRLAQQRVEEAAALAAKVGAADRLIGRATRTRFLALAVLERDHELHETLQLMIDCGGFSAAELAMYGAWRAAIAGEDAIVHADAEAADSCLANLEALAKMHAADAFERLVSVLVRCMPDERARGERLAELYVRQRFVDMAGDEYIGLIERFGPDARLLAGLGKVATMREMWDDAVMLLEESLRLDPTQAETRRLLQLITHRQATA